MKRIGLFGGTFDPIHHGHLRAAVEVKEGFDLDRVFLIPAASPPHKKPGEVTAAADRLKMVELAVVGNSGLTAADLELKRSGPSYSIDTVGHFKQAAPHDSKIFSITGLDAFLEIDSWKSYQNLLKEVIFIVISRPITDPTDNASRWKRLNDFLQSKISAKYEFCDSAYFKHPDALPIYTFEVTALDISSTRIRTLVKKRQSIAFLVPEKVENYIKIRGLYT